MKKVLLAIIAIIILTLTTIAKANEGFFLMIGTGINDSMFNDAYKWENNNEAGCGIGLGYITDINKRWTFSLGAIHRSQCLSGQPINDEAESSAEFYYADFYYFPFK